MTLQTDIIQTPTGGPVELTGQSAAKAWANLNGTGVVALRDSFNVSSLVDNTTGDYTINFTSNFTSGNYSVGAIAARGATAGANITASGQTDGFNANSFDITCQQGGTIYDGEYVTCNIHGGLA